MARDLLRGLRRGDNVRDWVRPIQNKKKGDDGSTPETSGEDQENPSKTSAPKSPKPSYSPQATVNVPEPPRASYSPQDFEQPESESEAVSRFGQFSKVGENPNIKSSEVGQKTVALTQSPEQARRAKMEEEESPGLVDTFVNTGAAAGLDTLFNTGTAVKGASDIGAGVNAGMTAIDAPMSVPSTYVPGAEVGSVGTLGTAASLLGPTAVAAYYGPSAVEHGGEIIGNAVKGDFDKIDSDSAVKGTLLSNPVTAWAVPIMDKLGIDINSGKHKDQQMRDAGRDAIAQQGVAIKENGKHYIELADGSRFDLWKDGDWQGYKVGWNDPDFDVEAFGRGEIGAGKYHDAIGMTAPLAVIQFQGSSPKLAVDFTGYYSNAVMQSGDPTANAQKLYADAGLDRDSAYTAILQMGPKEDGGNGTLDAGARDAYLAAIDKLFGVPGPGSGASAPASHSSGGGGRSQGSSAPTPATPYTSPTGPVVTPIQTPPTQQPVSEEDYVQAIINTYANNAPEGKLPPGL